MTRICVKCAGDHHLQLMCDKIHWPTHCWFCPCFRLQRNMQRYALHAVFFATFFELRFCTFSPKIFSSFNMMPPKFRQVFWFRAELFAIPHIRIKYIQKWIKIHVTMKIVIINIETGMQCTSSPSMKWMQCECWAFKPLIIWFVDRKKLDWFQRCYYLRPRWMNKSTQWSDMT